MRVCVSMCLCFVFMLVFDSTYVLNKPYRINLISAKEVTFLPLCVFLSVCQQDNSINCGRNFSEGWDVTDSILARIRIMMRIQEFLKGMFTIAR